MNATPNRIPLLVGATLLGILASCGGGSDAGRPRNVVLISIDTLRPDFLGCYGADRDTSPAIDRLAGEGVVFEDVTSAAPWTLPGHASMLTGLYPSTHGVKDHVNTLQAETLATWLSRKGFETMAVVNSHNIGSPEYGLVRGFDKDRCKYLFEMEPPTGGPIVNRGEEITETALSWLKDRDQRPFFLFLHYYDVHTDFTPKARYKTRFVEPYDGRLNGKTGQLVKFRDMGTQLSPEDLRFLREMYDAEIRQLDDVLAGFFAYLDESGLADDTLVVITSDHGEEYQEHGGLLHGRTQYQELLAIPLVIRGPGVPEGHRVGLPVHQVDIAPTIYSLLGVDPPPAMDGIDLTNCWRNPAALPEKRFLYGEADHNNVVDGEDVIDIKKMIRQGDEKLCYDTLTGKMELYDLATDPGEHRDISAEEPATAQALMEQLKSYMEHARPGVHILGPDGTPIAGPDAEAMKVLAAAGYVGGGDEDAASGDGAGASDATPATADPVAAMNAAIQALMARPEKDAESIEVQHILIGFAGAPQIQATRSRAEAEALAADVYARLEKGEDMDALMKQYSDDPGAGVYAMTMGKPTKAGEMPRRGMVPAFGDVGWRLEVGEVGVAPHDIKKSPYGWHVIKRLR